jgi:RimJ/RimL family protein N-acetyltransferase
VHVFAAFFNVVRLDVSGAGAGRQSRSSFATKFSALFFLIIFRRDPLFSIVMIVLQTPRLILRSFTDTDLDELSTLMANEDFMRFSLGVMSREQTAAFLEKMQARDRSRYRHRSASLFGQTDD